LWAYVEMYESTLNLAYLDKAKRLTKEMIDLFWDQQDGGFFFTGKDNEELLIRQKEAYDGAIPSGNSVAALQMIRLARLTGDFELEEKVQQLFNAFALEITRYPAGHTVLLQSYLLTQMGMKEVIVIAAPEESGKLLEELQREFHPEITFLVSDSRDKLAETAPFTKEYRTIKDQTAVYVCENFICSKPTTDIEEAITLINSKDR
jgi:uncharacterized protein YyaL (SSP411 family)